MWMRRYNKGITVIELTVVIAIILVLATMIVPQAFKLRQKAKIALAKAQIFEIAEALGIANAQVGEYPIYLADLGEASGGGGAHFTKVPLTDSWGNLYFYGAWELDGVVYSSPTLYRHSPSPEWQILNFEAVAGEYTIILTVSDVSSAKVKLNGESIFSPSDFNAHTTSVEKTVTIDSSNTIDLRIASNPGATMTIRVISPSPPESITADGLPPLEYAGTRYNWSSVYFSRNEESGFILGSYGRDGEVGGRGLNQDIIYKVTFGR